MIRGYLMKHLTLFSLFCGAGLFSTPLANASALIQIDHRAGIVYVTSRLVYSGPALTKAIADEATREIHDMWNEIPTEVRIATKPYRIEFDIDYVMAGEQELKNPESCAYNFIQVRNKVNAGDRSYYTNFGAQTGVFFTSDNLGHSTTAAHEFGHGLVLSHNNHDQTRAPVPGIMFARGTLVRPEFQYDPKAKPGAPGGTINPIYRKVRSIDIQTIPLNSVILRSGSFSHWSMGCLGAGKPETIE